MKRLLIIILILIIYTPAQQMDRLFWNGSDWKRTEKVANYDHELTYMMKVGYINGLLDGRLFYYLKAWTMEHAFADSLYAETVDYLSPRELVKVLDNFYMNSSISKKEIFPRKTLTNNGYYVFKNSKKSALAYYDSKEEIVYRVEKDVVSGIKPRNAEQAFAIHALTNPKIPLVSVNGVAGTGKTLLALASAISQRRNYKQIFVARPIVPLSNKDLGYLPGDISSKINPYMEPLWDNFKFIQNQFKVTSKVLFAEVPPDFDPVLGFIVITGGLRVPVRISGS